MLGIADARFQAALERTAKASRQAGARLRPASRRWRATHAEQLARDAAPFRADGLLPDYPLGCDFTAVEQRLVRALAWLKDATRRPGVKLRTMLRALRRATDGDAGGAAAHGPGTAIGLARCAGGAPARAGAEAHATPAARP